MMFHRSCMLFTALLLSSIISPSYRTIVETRATKRETSKRGKWIILLLLCVPNGFAVIQKVDVGGDKVCTQTANFKMKLHDSVVGRRLL